VFIPNTNIFYSAGSDGRLFRWDLDDKARKPALVANNKTINRSLSVSNNGKWMICGTSGMAIIVFKLGTGNIAPDYFKGTTSNITCLTFLPDNIHFISTGDDNKIFIWNIETGDYKEFATLNTSVLCLTASNDGKTIAAGTKDGKIILWDVENGNQTILFQANKNPVHAISFSHNAKYLATGDAQGNLKLWSMVKKSLVTTLTGHTARISDIKFSADDNFLATASFDASVLLYQTTDLSIQPIRIKDHDSWVLSIAFNQAGDKIISGSLNGNRLVVSPTKTKLLSDEICKKLNRNMTIDEWNNFVGADITYENTCQ
jgi:predicted NACHT family NTPase